jgi:hypothetical protein
MIEGIGSAFLLVAAWLWWKSLRAIVRGLRSRSWPTTRGSIQTARVVKKRNSRGVEVWRYDVEYTYSVRGQDYRGTRLQFGIPNSLRWGDPSKPSFRQLRRGAAVDVHHSPLRPSVSALQAGVSPFAFLTLAAGGVIAWMGHGLLTLPG